MSIYCLHCSSIITRPKKFCNNSCAAKHNNKNRTLKPRNKCITCSKHTKSLQTIYCSHVCFGLSRKLSTDDLKANNAARQSRYRAKQYKVLDSTADKQKIKLIYKNCPDGYEVDHIIPLSKGGKHHEDNLQYLTKEDNRRKNNRLVGDPGYDPSHQSVMSRWPSQLARLPIL